MDKRKFLVAVSLFLASAFGAQGYSLSELVDSAYKHSHLMTIADVLLEQNNEAVSEARRNMLPAISFAGNYNYAITPYNAFANVADDMGSSFTDFYLQTVLGNSVRTLQPFEMRDTVITSMLDMLTSGLTHIPPHTLSGGIDIRQTIFAQKKLLYAVQYARSQGRGLICHWQDVRMRVKADITRKYYSALIAQKRSEIEKTTYEIAKQRHFDTKTRFESQTLSQLDTLNSFVDVTQASIRLREAKRMERENFRAIALAAGLKEHIDSIVLSDTLLPSAVKIEYDLLMKHFLAENKDLRMLQTEVELAQLGVKIAKSDYFPVVFGGLALNRIANFTGRHDFYFAPERKAYLGLTYDITPFGQRGLRVRQREHDLKIARHNYEHRKEQLTLLLNSYYEMLVEEISKIEESEMMLSASQKALSLAQSRYAGGLISQTDMELAEQKFRTSGLAYLQAIFGYNSLMIDLRIIGANYLYEPHENP